MTVAGNGKGQITNGRNIKWSYMDHWSMLSPRGFVAPMRGPQYADRFFKQLVGLGFEGVDPFEFRLNGLIQMLGSAKQAEQFAQDRGIERFVNMFCCFFSDQTHVREQHDGIVQAFESKLKQFEGIKLDSFIVMPAARYWQAEPITDEKIKLMAECWNRVGKVTKKHGIWLTCHHEFYCGLHFREEIDKFYEYTDPEYVGFFLDTAQHQIAGIDPTDLYVKHHKRVTGFHFKDTHHIDKSGDYRTPPDPERDAATTKRWFWEMGTPQGLVDFPKLMKAMKDLKYTGWVTVEHDKADVGGGNYAESTSRAKWYIDNVLSPIYA